MKWRVINASVRGSAHQRSGLPNQDAVDYGSAPKSDAPLTVLAVSDGHGGGRHFRSQVGSTLAVHVSVQVVQDYLARPAAGDDLSQLTQEIVEAWLAAVMSDLAHNPFSEAELSALEETDGERSKDSVVERPELAYGATLLVAAVTDERMIYLQLGDGDILTVAADGATTRPIAVDERLVGNQTTSLCQPAAWREFRMSETATSAGLPVLVLLSTDGYVNSFRSQEDFMQIGKDYLQILREQGSEVLADELPRILTDATQQGSGDDITLGLLHMEVLPAAPLVVGVSSASAAKTSKSVIIREMTAERSTQQKKLTELETLHAGAQKHVLQLRLAIAGVALAAIVLLTHQYWMPWFQVKPVKAPVTEPVKRPTKGSPEVSKGGPGDPLTPPPESGAGDKPSAGTPANTDVECVLTLTGGVELVLKDKTAVSTSDLAIAGEKQPYALVKQLSGTLFLKNLSGDLWTVTSPNSGKTSKVAKPDNVTLRTGTLIKFRDGESGTVAYRNKPSKDNAGTVTAEPTVPTE